jgi:hypothetical protein
MAEQRLAADYEGLLRLMDGIPRGRLLDVPCGPGILARALSARGFSEIVGIDILPAEAFEGPRGCRYLRHDIDTPYFPTFRDMGNDREALRRQAYQGHVSPMYFWQLVTFLERYGSRVEEAATDTTTGERRPYTRLLHRILAVLIRHASRHRGFDDLGVMSDALLFGDTLIVRARKDRKPS